MIKLLLITATIIFVPQWSEVLGHVNCLNAYKQQHFVSEECEVTVCFFENESYMVFNSCGREGLQCVLIDAQEATSCPEETTRF